MDRIVSQKDSEIDVASLDEQGLLKLYVKVLSELKARGVVRSTNNPVADLAESLAARVLGGQLTAKSQASYDMIVEKLGQRLTYQVKTRRITSHNQSRLLGGLRGMDVKRFDFLVGILFNEDLTPRRGAVIPWEVVKENSTHNQHTNSWRFVLRDKVWDMPGVQDLPLSSW